MTYDHYRGIKLFNLGGSLRGLTEEEVLAEIDKTDVVCQDCHELREIARSLAI